MFRFGIAAGMTAWLLAGCASTVPINHQNIASPPAITFHESSLEAVQSLLIKGCEGESLVLTRVTPRYIECSSVMWPEIDPQTFQTITQNAFRHHPTTTTRFPLAVQGDNVQVSAQRWINTNSENRGRRRIPLTSVDQRHDLQNMLYRMNQ